jgi:2-iminobutanoate/2-iminopropanoate deaminase
MRKDNGMGNQVNEEVAKSYGPYSPVRQAGDTFYIAGQIGIDPETKRASDGVADQVNQTLKNLGVVLGTVGLGYDDVVKATLYLTDMGTFTQVNEVYVNYFHEPRPARTAVGAAELPRVAGDTKLVFEIDAVAVRSTS